MRDGPPDVIVVGAGPAGATAARALALGGVRVQLLERSTFPRSKPCGGAVSLRALGRFPYLEAALERIPTRRISKLYLEGPAGRGVTIESPEPAVLTIRRIEFDHLLATLAVEAGVDLREGATVCQAAVRPRGGELTSRDGRVFRSPIVIAADGVNSVVARRLGFNRGWRASTVALDMMEETPTETLRSTHPDVLWVHYGYQGSHGYAYVFPKQAHVNVGVGYLLSYFRREITERPYELQRRFIEELCQRDALSGASSRETFTPYLLPVGGPLPETARGRVLLVGDAGGFVNGFTAEGIYHAMVSGDLAARTVLAERTRAGGSSGALSDLDLRPYESRWRREIGTELRDSVLLREYVFGRHGRVDRMVDGAARNPSTARFVARYAAGTLSYAQIRRRMVARYPLLAFRVAASYVQSLGRRAAS